MNSYVQLLRRVPLFQGFSESDLVDLETRLQTRTLGAGELLFAKGDAGNSMFIIVSGSVKVFLPAHEPGGTVTVLQELETGDFVGEMALLDNQPRMASVSALAETVLVELTRESFVEQLEGSPKIGAAMLGVMSKRLRVAAKLLEGPTARDINKEADEKLTWAQHLADKAAQWNGSWSFILVLLAFALIWIESNAISGLQFDPYPYQFFNLFLAILVALQGPLIMMSQNRQVMKERLHAEADYQVNLKNETGIDQILKELDDLRGDLLSVRRDIERLKPSASSE